MINIALSGAHCSGKTTLLNLMKQDVFFQNFNFIESFSTKISKNTKHSENTNIQTQLEMLYYSMETLYSTTTDLNIFDRCILDVIVYSGLNNDIKLENVFTDVLTNNYKRFNKIFILDAEHIPIESNGIRSIDEGFRKKINDVFMKVDLENCYHLSSKLTAHKRINEIKDVIINDLKEMRWTN